MIHKNENVWAQKWYFFTSTARIGFEVYGQTDKITPEAGKKMASFY